MKSSTTKLIFKNEILFENLCLVQRSYARPIYAQYLYNNFGKHCQLQEKCCILHSVYILFFILHFIFTLHFSSKTPKCLNFSTLSFYFRTPFYLFQLLLNHDKPRHGPGFQSRVHHHFGTDMRGHFILL